MAKTKAQKQKIIENLKENLQKKKALILVDFTGLDSKALSELREDFRKNQGLFQVVKKTLLKKALKILNKKSLLKKIEEIQSQLALGFAFQDEISLFKICYQYSQKNEKLKILGGVLGEEFLEKEKTVELATLPSRKETISRFIRDLNSLILNFLNTLRGNFRVLCFLLNQIKNKG